VLAAAGRELSNHDARALLKRHGLMSWLRVICQIGDEKRQELAWNAWLGVCAEKLAGGDHGAGE
jgi:hypothetical protein